MLLQRERCSRLHDLQHRYAFRKLCTSRTIVFGLLTAENEKTVLEWKLLKQRAHHSAEFGGYTASAHELCHRKANVVVGAGRVRRSPRSLALGNGARMDCSELAFSLWIPA